MKKTLVILIALLVTGCASTIVVPDGSVTLNAEPAAIMSIHSRVFASADYRSLTQASHVAIKELGYRPGSFDAAAGVVVATKEDSVFSMGELVGKAIIAGLFGGSPRVRDKVIHTASISVTRDPANLQTSRVFVQVRSTLLDTTGATMNTALQGKDSPVYEELFFMISEKSGIEHKEWHQ